MTMYVISINKSKTMLYPVGKIGKKTQSEGVRFC